MNKPYNKSRLNVELRINLLATLVTFLLLLIRFSATNTTTYGFLLWNIFLAWVAWGLGALFITFKETKLSLRKWLTLITWILFLPNTFYLLTDFIHPIFGFDKVEDYVDIFFSASNNATLITFDIILIATATWTGWLLGILSLRHLHGWLKNRLTKTRAMVSIHILILACSFAIYLGRIPRWNSWDILRSPIDFLLDIGTIFLHPSANSQAYAITGMFFVLISLVYWSIELLAPSKKQQ